MRTSISSSAAHVIRAAAAMFIVVAAVVFAAGIVRADNVPRFSFWSVDPNANTISKFVRLGGERPQVLAGGPIKLTFQPVAVVSTGWTEDEAVGQRVYIADTRHGLVWQYLADQDGHLTPLSPSNISVGRVLELRLDPVQNLLYVLRADGPMTLKIRGSGTLRLVQTAPAPVDSQPVSMAISPTGGALYVAGTGGAVGGRRHSRPTDPDGSISQYQINTDGSIGALDPPIVPAGDVPISVTVDRSGQFVYAASVKSKSLSQFKVDAGGVLEPLDPDSVDLPTAPSAVAADPVRGLLYVLIAKIAKSKWPSELLTYRIGADGALAGVGGSSEPAPNSKSMVVDPGGDFLYLLGGDGSVVAGFQLKANGLPEAADWNQPSVQKR